jgi:hypothetical protein
LPNRSQDFSPGIYVNLCGTEVPLPIKLPSLKKRAWGRFAKIRCDQPLSIADTYKANPPLFPFVKGGGFEHSKLQATGECAALIPATDY